MTENTSRKLAAIMFADIVSYSRLMGSNEGEALKLLKDFENISAEIVNEYEGVIIKKNGDQIFCEFTSAKNAVDASLKIQRELSKYNDSRPKDFKLEVRIGIHIGDVVKREDGDIHGDGVNVAARIQPLASPGGICVSGAVSDALSSHPDYDVISKGEQELKNILHKHSIYQIKTGFETIEPVTSKNAIKSSGFSKIIYGVIGVLILVIIFNKTNYHANMNSVVEKNVLVLADIKSNDRNMEYVKNRVYEVTGGSDILFEYLTDKEKSNIYDELTSFIEINNIRDDIEYITKYDLIDRFNKKGEEVPQYSFNYYREFAAIDPNSENILEQKMEIMGKIYADKTSTYNFLINSSADLGYFPLLYKINTSADKTEYCLLHFLVYNEIKFTEQDTSKNFRYLFSWDILERNDLVEAMADFIENRIYKYLAVNRGIVEVVNENELLFKFNKDLKNKLKSRMILDTKREYMYNSKTDQFDVFIKEVIADHLEYEKSVQKDTESVNYTNYHNVNMNNMLPYTKGELMRLQAKTHEFYENEIREGGFKTGKSFGLYIKIQIKEVYDSTASATVYESGDPNIKLKKGDIVLF